MSSSPVNVGIVGLGRWAKVLTRAAAKSEKIRIIAGFSRSEEKRLAFEQELGVSAAPDMRAMLSNPAIEGVILTVPNQQHLPVADRYMAEAKSLEKSVPARTANRKWRDGITMLAVQMPPSA